MYECRVTLEAICEVCNMVDRFSSYRGTEREQARDAGWYVEEKDEDIICYCPYHHPDENKRKPLPWVTEMPLLQIQDICIAYESGFGHGIQNDNLPNPYPKNTPSYEAYNIGMKARNKEQRCQEN